MTVTTTKGWAEHAACRGLDPEIFMATRGDLLKIREAKKICDTCDVIHKCREYSLHLAQNYATYGVFGGWSRNERINYLRTVGLHVRRWGGTEPATNSGSGNRGGGHGTATAVRRHKSNGEQLCPECQAGDDRRRSLVALSRRRQAVKKRQEANNERTDHLSENVAGNA
jgi:WhiB family redox-sensing transcriptional regulator